MFAALRFTERLPKNADRTPRPAPAGLRNSAILFCLFVVALSANASATLLMEEPYGDSVQ